MKIINSDIANRRKAIIPNKSTGQIMLSMYSLKNIFATKAIPHTTIE
jgi:hypothetical protein